MKNLIIFSTILFYTAFANSQEDIENLKGEIYSIKKIYILPFKKNNKWEDGKIQAVFETFFDREKRIVKEIEKNDKNIILQKNYVYKSSQQTKQFCKDLIEDTHKTSSFSQLDETPLEKFCSENMKHDLTMKIQYNITPDEKTQKPFKIFFYKKAKNFLEETAFDSENFMEYRIVSKYDKNSYIKERIKYDSEMHQIEKEIHNYSFSPLIKTIKYFDSNDILKKEIKEEYRTDNTLRKKTEIIYDNLEIVFSKTETEFDSTGLKSKERIYSQDNTLQRENTYEYLFDKNGNWIKEIKYEKIKIYDKLIDSENPPQIIKREIEYYLPQNK